MNRSRAKILLQHYFEFSLPYFDNYMKTEIEEIINCIFEGVKEELKEEIISELSSNERRFK